MFVYAAIAFSGLTALGAEVVWTRLLSLLLGATVYTFSIILAVFLTGLWAGSGAGSFLARRVRDPRLALAGCQILLAAGDRLDSFHARVCAALLARRSVAFDQPLVQFRSGPDALRTGHFSGDAAVGRQLSIGAGRRGGEHGGSRTIDGRGLCSQYRRVHRGRVGVQSAADSGDRNARLATGIDLVGGGRRGGCRGAGGFRERPVGDCGRRSAGAAAAGVGPGCNRRRRSLAGHRLRPPRRAHSARPESRHRCANHALCSWARESTHRW